jgi:predicted Rossmann-fold nucleotide-binding protein
MSARRPILGVIGGGKQRDLARQLGKAIGSAQSILLTGGEALETSNEAKDAAMVGVNEVKGRFISILPRTEEHPVVANWDDDQSHFLKLRSGLTSEERDPINGLTPDALFVLIGGSGTLCELAFAVAGGKGLIFLDSSAIMLDKFKERSGIGGALDEVLKAALGKFPGADDNGQYHIDELKRSLGVVLRCAVDAYGAPDEIVKHVANHYASKQLGDTGFPGLLPDVEGTKQRFKEWLMMASQ